MRGTFSGICVGGPLHGKCIGNKLNPMTYVDLRVDLPNEIDMDLNLKSCQYHWEVIPYDNGTVTLWRHESFASVNQALISLIPNISRKSLMGLLQGIEVS